jgi:hypothetical protein
MLALLRSIVAVLVGYTLFAVSAFALFRVTGHDAHAPASLAFMLVTILEGVVFASAGGYLAGWIAGGQPVAHAFAVAVVIAAGAVASLVATLGHGAVWTQVAALAFGAGIHGAECGAGRLVARARDRDDAGPRLRLRATCRFIRRHHGNENLRLLAPRRRRSSPGHRHARACPAFRRSRAQCAAGSCGGCHASLPARGDEARHRADVGRCSLLLSRRA